MFVSIGTVLTTSSCSEPTSSVVVQSVEPRVVVRRLSRLLPKASDVSLPTLLMLFEAYALSIKTPVKISSQGPPTILTIIVVRSAASRYYAGTTESTKYKVSVENLVPIPSEFEGISDDTFDVPNCDDNRVNVESELVESLISRDASIVYSSKIDPILEEFAGELAHIAPIPPGIVEADFDPNDKLEVMTDDLKDRSLLANIRKRREVAVHYSLLITSSRGEGENIVVSNVEEDDSFTFTIRTFLLFITYTEVSPLSSFTGSEDTIFDPGTDIKEKDKNKDKTGQNRAWDRKEHEKTNPKKEEQERKDGRKRRVKGANRKNVEQQWKEVAALRKLEKTIEMQWI
ncbi:hypothetical protein Tco_0403419 [Tanacetum coccineum]